VIVAAAARARRLGRLGAGRGRAAMPRSPRPRRLGGAARAAGSAASLGRASSACRGLLAASLGRAFSSARRRSSRCSTLARSSRRRASSRGKARLLRPRAAACLHFLAGGHPRPSRGLRGAASRRALGAGLGASATARRGGFGGGASPGLPRMRRFLTSNDNRVGAAVAEALLDLAGLDRALEAQRRPGAKLRFFGLVCHSIPSSIFFSRAGPQGGFSAFRPDRGQ
jgi:hypothetical protein